MTTPSFFLRRGRGWYRVVEISCHLLEQAVLVVRMKPRGDLLVTDDHLDGVAGMSLPERSSHRVFDSEWPLEGCPEIVSSSSRLDIVCVRDGSIVRLELDVAEELGRVAGEHEVLTGRDRGHSAFPIEEELGASDDADGAVSPEAEVLRPPLREVRMKSSVYFCALDHQHEFPFVACDGAVEGVVPLHHLETRPRLVPKYEVRERVSARLAPSDAIRDQSQRLSLVPKMALHRGSCVFGRLGVSLRGL